MPAINISDARTIATLASQQPQNVKRLSQAERKALDVMLREIGSKQPKENFWVKENINTNEIMTKLTAPTEKGSSSIVKKVIKGAGNILKVRTSSQESIDKISNLPSQRISIRNIDSVISSPDRKTASNILLNFNKIVKDLNLKFSKGWDEDLTPLTNEDRIKILEAFSYVPLSPEVRQEVRDKINALYLH